jgi:hypothetical protein
MSKGEKTGNGEKEEADSARKNGFKILQYFFSNGVWEMMKNASCFNL